MRDFVRPSGLWRPRLLALLVLVGAGASAAEEPSVADRVRLVLHARIPASGEAPRLELEGEGFRASPALACFYQRRRDAAAWSADGRIRPAAGELLAALAAAGDDGLSPEAYRPAALGRLAAAVASRPDPGGLADLDLLLSDAFLTFAAHLSHGKVNPAAIYSDCALRPDVLDLADALEDALRTGQIRAALAGLAPPQPGYRRLREALARYRRLAAQEVGPASLPAGHPLREGDRGERVVALRGRLAEASLADAAEPLPPAAAADLFDPPLKEALRRFQERHGLEGDGVAGRATLLELDQRAPDHVRQLEVNLERWRWLPRDLGRRHVLVNIAGFRLEAVADGRTDLAMRVVVGKPYTRTPMFSSAIKSVLLNPPWYPPKSIAVKEIFPKARKDPSYLAREGFEVLPGGRLRQRPGDKSALGRIKFEFPNPFDVYLHDTPARTLFGRTSRAFSHGCIRVERPLDLAVWALAGDPHWNEAAIRAGIDAKQERRLPLPGPIAVHIAYWTAWVDDRGTLTLGRDVYGRDAELARRLAGAR